MNETPIFDRLDHSGLVPVKAEPLVPVVIIDEHAVDASIVDLFYDMKTGKRVTDTEWDETQRRLAEAI